MNESLNTDYKPDTFTFLPFFSRQHLCVYYLPSYESIVLQQAPDINILIRVLQETKTVSALSEEYLVATETADNLFQFDSYAFAFCLERFVLMVDIEAVVEQLTEAWSQHRPGEEEIISSNKEELIR